MQLDVGADGLVVAGRAVPADDVLGFHERFDPWRGAVWLEIAGPGLRVRVEEGYGDVRARLRRRFPRLPYTADWAPTGRFPALVLGGPPAPWTALVVGVAAAVTAAVGALAGPGAGLLAALGLVWPVGRLHAALQVDAVGLRAGPVWAPVLGWHEIHEVRAKVEGRRTRLFVAHEGGVAELQVATAVLPAVRARVERLGALPLVPGGLDLDLRYRAMRPAALGLPWGVLGAVLVAAPWFDDPWKALARGLLVAAATGMVGAAVEARLSGWRTGGIFWMTVAWGALLAAWALGVVG